MTHQIDVKSALDTLNRCIVECHRCQRLVEWRERIAREKKRAHANETYWGRPVPCFGDDQADHLIVGLAPAAHGANRTGRMFTGDQSGVWLYRALHKAGVASQPESLGPDDGMMLSGVLITAAVHCAPPDNKPLPEELANCAPFLEQLLLMRKWRSVLCLGTVAWERTHRTLGVRAPKFAHLIHHRPEGCPTLVGSYHPSQQNTFTGRLTEPMLDAAIQFWLRS